MNLSKTFDSVDRQTLLDKLEMMGFRGLTLEIIKSYLSNRQQRVIGEDTTSAEVIASEWQLIKKGLPQGSLMGCILYILYCNDLPCVCSYDLGMYADDTSVIIQTSDTNEMIEEISVSMQQLSTWFNQNNLKLNIEKTKIVQFSLKSEQEFQIIYDTNTLASVQSSKFLGVTIDTKLNWKQHVDDLRAKISVFIYALRTIATLVSREAGMSSYYAYVYSRIRYGIQLWGNSVDAQKIFKIQKSCLRSIFQLSSRDSCREIYKNNKILTFPSL